MQKILDLTQDSLAQAFAALERSARRQRFLYFATIVLLVVIVVVSALVVAVLASARHLDYRRGQVVQYATDVSSMLNREASFLRRTELTVGYYETTNTLRPVPDGAVDQVRQSGVATVAGKLPSLRFDLLIPESTRAAWNGTLESHLSRIYEASDATLATQQAFELRHRAYLIGLTDVYGVILPAMGPSASRKTPALQPDQAKQLRDAIGRELQARVGRSLPMRDELVWVGPWLDPVQGIQVMSAVTASYTGDTATTLIVASVPADTFLAMLNRAGDPGTLLFVSAAQGVVTSAPPATPEEVSRLQAMSRDAARDRFTYARTGVLLAEPTTPPVGSLIYFLSYRQLAATLAGQFAIIALLSLLIIAAILLTARFWGMRLLRQSHAETARALESETINHILVSATPVGLCIVRQRDYSLLTSNQLAAVLLHLDSATTLPPHVVSAFREQGGHEPATSTFAKIAGFIVPAFPDQQRDTHPQFLQITYAPARYAGEDVLFCAILDVTAQQTLEQELRSAQHASETMMRARSNFFASMSHEIRTPLNALLGNLELLSRSPGLKPHEQRLRAVGMAADGLRRIVNDILDFSKIDAGEMKLVMENFRPIDDLESLALSYAPMSADRPVRFYAHLAVTLDQVLRGDRARIAQIINNLLSNAFKFTSCGKITLNAEVLRDVQDRDILVCRVCDSGIGMDAVLVSKIFSPFVQAEASTSSRYGGTGLGLSICAKLCELMGGQISVESVPGVGTAFTVMIPLETLHDSSLLVTAPVQRGNVLVLCQEIESGKFIEPWMNRGGWLCNTVASRRAAEASLLNNGPHFMIVTGEYGMEDIVALRTVRAVPVTWITRTAPHRAVRHGDGIFEVSEFNHKVTLACIERALGESPGESDAAPAVPTAVNGPDPALDGLVILVAEDNPLNQALIAEQLDTLGCQPIIVGDGRQALAALQSTEVDIVLSDIHMPVMDGHELLEHLRASHSHLPVLAFSAVTSNEQAEDWRARGFADYVAKPASLKELETALLRVVRGWQANAAPAGVNAGAATTEKAGPSPAGMDPAEKARYMAMLRDYLITDLPKLEAVIGSQDAAALRQRTHSSAGAFLVVQEHELATQCRELERLCDAETEWTTDMAQRALNLHTALHERFGLGGDAA